AMGCNGTDDTSSNVPNDVNGRVFNVTGLRYAINLGTRGKPSSVADNTCADGICANYGNNTPLRSEHTGGVNALFGDGSVRFLRDSTDAATLARLASRNDGLPVTLD